MIPPDRRALAIMLLSALAVTACGNGEPESTQQETALPDGLAVYVDQSRIERVTRDVFVRLVNEPERTITVTRAEISFARAGDVTWEGEETFQNEADLDFEMPRGDCGGELGAEVTLTYRIDDGPERVSTTAAADRYSAIGLILDRDCAEQTLSEAADLELGEAEIVGQGEDAVFELPVTITPTGGRDDVVFEGFDDTVLFRNTTGSSGLATWKPSRLGPDDPAIHPVLRLVPTRCDPHALAEDKVGTLIPVHVAASGLPANASFFLPISDEQRADLRGYFAVRCEL